MLASDLWIHSGFLYSESTTQENIASLYNKPTSSKHYKVQHIEFFNYVPRNLDPAVYITTIADGEFDTGAFEYPARRMVNWTEENQNISFFWKNGHNFQSYYGINGWLIEQYLFKDTSSYCNGLIIKPGDALSFSGASSTGMDFLITLKIIISEESS